MRTLIAGLLFALFAPLAQGQGLTLGYNQGWLEGGWGHDLTDRFDADAWARVLRRARLGGGSVLRVWLLEDKAWEGVRWSGHRPEGVEPSFLANLRAVCELAEAEGVQLYWAMIDGNWHWDEGLEFDRQFNVLNDKYAHGARFRERVLGPILDVLAERPRALYGLDLINEVQGAVREHVWPDGWAGARRFLATSAAFAHARVPGLRVTASSGHHTAAWDLLAGRFDGLGFDLYDVHVYSDAGQIPFARFLARHARTRGLPIVVGEFGQKDARSDDALQARVVSRLLAHARRHGFAAAFAWRLEDEQPHDRRFSFFDGDRPRPALDAMRAAAGLPALTPATGLTGALAH